MKRVGIIVTTSANTMDGFEWLGELAPWAGSDEGESG